MKIGILIVAYNAVTTLVQVLKRIPSEVWENIAEVAVFDDASSDSTYELAVGYKTVSGTVQLRVFTNESNLGYGGNQKAGYRYFAENNFDVVVLLHGDGQYAPEILHHLYHPIVAGEADAVFGSRMMSDYGGALTGNMPLYKYLGNRVLSAFENHALGMHLTEFHSGYRAYSLRALRRISMSAMTDDFHFDTEIIIKLHHQGYRIVEVPIPTYYGNEICHVNGLGYAYNVVRSVARYKSTKRSARRYPEFEEYFVDYPFKDHALSSHRVCRKFAGTRNAILDVGCGNGYFAAAIAADGNEVTGIDIIPAPRRRDVFSQYVCADLNDGLFNAMRSVQRKSFDKVLLMDILQQLPSPNGILRDAARLLTPNGEIIVSVPNVANIATRLLLAAGQFDYADRGILDRAHLRFFTRKTAQTMLEASGLKVLAVQPTAVPIELVMNLSPRNVLGKMLAAVVRVATTCVPNLFAYQWVFVARRGEPRNDDGPMCDRGRMSTRAAGSPRIATDGLA